MMELTEILNEIRERGLRAVIRGGIFSSGQVIRCVTSCAMRSKATWRGCSLISPAVVMRQSSGERLKCSRNFYPSAGLARSLACSPAPMRSLEKRIAKVAANFWPLARVIALFVESVVERKILP